MLCKESVLRTPYRYLGSLRAIIYRNVIVDGLYIRR